MVLGISSINHCQIGADPSEYTWDGPAAKNGVTFYVVNSKDYIKIHTAQVEKAF